MKLKSILVGIIILGINSTGYTAPFNSIPISVEWLYVDISTPIKSGSLNFAQPASIASSIASTGSWASPVTSIPASSSSTEFSSSSSPLSLGVESIYAGAYDSLYSLSVPLLRIVEDSVQTSDTESSISSSTVPSASVVDSSISIPTSSSTSITGSSLQSPSIASSGGANGIGSISNSLGNSVAIPSASFGDVTGSFASLNGISNDVFSSGSSGATSLMDISTSATIIPLEIISILATIAGSAGSAVTSIGTSLANLGGSGISGSSLGGGASSFLPPSSLSGGSSGGSIAASSPGAPLGLSGGSLGGSSVAPSVAGPILGLFSWIGGAVKPKVPDETIITPPNDEDKLNCPNGNCGDKAMFGML